MNHSANRAWRLNALSRRTSLGWGMYVSGGGGAYNPLVLAFVIEATVVIDGVIQPVVFNAHLVGGGRVEVLPDVL